MTLDAPPERPAVGRRRGFAPFVLPGIVLALVYAAFGTWSIGQGFGGAADDGGWVDFHGDPTSTAPPVVDVVGHPALWVFAVLVGVLVLTGMWVDRADASRARRRAVVGVAVAAGFVLAVILVFTVLQMQLVEAAFELGDATPPVLGNVTVTVSRMTSG
jgi:hypothetical protein